MLTWFGLNVPLMGLLCSPLARGSPVAVVALPFFCGLMCLLDWVFLLWPAPVLFIRIIFCEAPGPFTSFDMIALFLATSCSGDVDLATITPVLCLVFGPVIMGGVFFINQVGFWMVQRIKDESKDL